MCYNRECNHSLYVISEMNQMSERNMEQRLKEYGEYIKREKRFKTRDEFLKFCSKHFCYYPSGFGSYIQTLITTENQFIDFIQRACIIDWYENSGGIMWFANGGVSEYVDFVDYKGNLIADNVDDDFEGIEPEICLTETYKIDYNPFYDDPFACILDKPEYTKKIFGYHQLKVKPEIIAKMPFIARYISVDDFDRMGSIKGETLEIISLNEVKENVIMFL